MWFNRITDSRFKVNKISVGFFTDFDELSRADYAVVPYILTDCCEKYPDYKSLSMRFADLYGASVGDDTAFGGDRRYTSVSISALDDRFALNGESIERESCELLCECIFRPLVSGGVFDGRLVRMMSSELIDAIDGVINDKRALAARNAAESAFVGEARGLSIQGTHEQAESITPESAYAAYRRMLKSGHVEIFAVGCSDFGDSEKCLADMFAAIERDSICSLGVKPSVLKPQPLVVTDRMPMQQAIMRMYFKAPDMEDRYANALMNMVLGGMTTSRFFENIREKQSLCYYCSSAVDRPKCTLTVYAGVEPCNASRTRQAVLDEIEDVCENGVSQDELERAKLEILNDVSSLYDSVGSIGSWYLGQVSDEEFISPEEYAERIKAVTAQRVREVCRQYKPDTFYTLCPEEESI